MSLILTKAGLNAYAQSETDGVKLQATHMAIGDGGGEAVAHTDKSEALVNETWRGELQEIKLTASGEVEFIGHVPITIGGWYIREIAIYADDTLLALSSHPETWKPAPEAPDKVELVITAPVKFANADNISMTVDTTKVLASQEHVAEKIEEHNTSEAAHANMLAGYAPKGHVHAISDVSGLAVELTRKAPNDHTHTTTETDYLSASAFSVASSASVTSGLLETPNNGMVYQVVDMPINADSQFHISYPMPEGWDRGTIKAKVLWLPYDGEAEGNELTLLLAAGAVSPGDSLDVAMGAAVTLSDAVIGNGLLHVSDASAAMTVGGTPELGDLLHFVLTRDVDGGTTNMTGVAAIIGLLIQYTCKQTTAVW
ncbi:phage tail protein [Pseudodesulfovibrio sp.]|uniref:phage tail-collar fiber domain-containing protein n=1 Tax=unclassified Pseudodesulfovibrio TaxID=2661612 RepID=UPI003B00400D